MRGRLAGILALDLLAWSRKIDAPASSDKS